MLDESKIYRYEEIDSTNLEAKRLAGNGASHGSLVVAKRQTAGRGRRGRSWESSKEGNLYFSLLLRPEFEKEKASMLTLVMALAVAKALGGRPGIKWPNDIVVDGKKLAGILTEMNLAQASSVGLGSKAENDYQVIIGVGINVVKQDFADAEIADKAISMEEVLGKNLGQQDKLLADIMKYFEIYYEQFCKDGNLAGLKDEYETFLVNKGSMVRVLDPQGEYEGRALGINEMGELLVETRETGLAGEKATDLSGESALNMPGKLRAGETSVVRTVYAGEVSVRGIYGYV